MDGNAKRKGSITEEDAFMLLQRYKAPMILTLLQEVAQVPETNIDWNALVNKSSTGITCPREYQMLWRHLAYCKPLIDKLEDDTESSDSDSDLEFELEASPAINNEASLEAAAWVKVLMSSSLPNYDGASSDQNLIAPMTVNVPNGHASFHSSDKLQESCSSNGLNIIIPVSIKKRPLPATTDADGNDGNVPSSSSKLPAKKKRKLWTKEEDMALITAVQKFGEGNWQGILKEDFEYDRTSSQLSQRWSILKKNFGKSNAGGISNPINSTLTEAQLSTRQAISMALNMPMIGSFHARHTGKAGLGNGVGSKFSKPPASVNPADQPGPSKAPPPFSQKGLNQSQSGMLQGTQKMGNSTINKFQTTQIKPSASMKPLSGPNTLIQKAAFAAGGRIATPSTAASLLEAAKNAVHIMPGVSVSMTPVPGAKPPVSTILSRPFSVCQTRAVTPASTAVPCTASGPGATQSPSQLPLHNDTARPSSQHHLEGKMTVPIVNSAPRNAEHRNATAFSSDSLTMPSKGGTKSTITPQKKTAITENKVLVVNQEESEDMDVMADAGGQTKPCATAGEDHL